LAGLPIANCYAELQAKFKLNSDLEQSLFWHDMKVTEKDVAHVADLANLELTGEERVVLLRDLNSILDYIDRLNQLDTTDVPPMDQVSDRYGIDQSMTGSERFAYASREDILEGLRKSLPHDVALQNAPDSDGTFFKVPKVIER
jgi:aspartyl-tRNA(Asn)/glutamyl-tRNA(Gln) amidotransferase subunit C